MNDNEAIEAALDNEREAFQRRARILSERNGSAPKQPVSRPQLPPVVNSVKKIKGKTSRK